MSVLYKTLDGRGLPCPGPVVLLKKALAGNTAEGSTRGDAGSNSARAAEEALEDAADGGLAELDILVDNEAALENILRYAGYSGCTVVSTEKCGDVHEAGASGSAVGRPAAGPSVAVPSAGTASGNDPGTGDVFWRIRLRISGSSSGTSGSAESVYPVPDGNVNMIHEASSVANGTANGVAKGTANGAANGGNVLSRLHAENKTMSAGNHGPKTIFIPRDVIGSGSEELGRLLMRGFLYALTECETVPERLILMNSGVRLAVAGSVSLANLGLLVDRGVEVLACGTCLEYFGLGDELAIGQVSNMYEIAGFLTAGDTLTV